MKNSELITSVLAFVLTVIVAAAAADTPPLTFKFTTTNVRGAIQTTPAGVNNAGVSVGQYEDRSKVFHGYLRNGEKLTTLDDPKGSNTVCANLNLNGEIRLSVHTSIPRATQRDFCIKRESSGTSPVLRVQQPLPPMG